VVTQPAKPTHRESFTSHNPVARSDRQPRQVKPLPTLPTGPRPGTFSINAPVLGAVGRAAVRTTTVELKSTGDWANTSSFIAPTTAGNFALQQVVQLGANGVVSANLAAAVSTGSDDTATQTYSSQVSTAPTVDGNVLVNVELVVVPQATAQPMSTVGTPLPLNINVHALYTPDVTTVLAETVSVVEGSASCCELPASSTPPSASSDGHVTSPSLDPAAVGSASVSPLSPSKLDDQSPPASS